MTRLMSVCFFNKTGIKKMKIDFKDRDATDYKMGAVSVNTVHRLTVKLMNGGGWFAIFEKLNRQGGRPVFQVCGQQEQPRTV